MKEYLKGLKFYEVQIQPVKSISYNCLRACTYRSTEEVYKVFQEQCRTGKIEKFRIVDLENDWILEDESYWFPMFCVELNKEYVNLKELIEDILVGKLSGILDVDVDFTGELDE